MILKVFSVRDVKAEAFLQPFFSPSVGSAMRAFSDAVNDKACPFNKHPEDYQLYELGEYDDRSGLLTALPVVKMFSGGYDVLDVRPDPVKLMSSDSKVALPELERVEQNGTK